MESVVGRRVFVCSVVAALLLVAGAGAGAQSPSPGWNAFVADITLHRYDVSADGTPVGMPAPVVTYRLERVEAPSGWRTTMTLTSGERPVVTSLRGKVDVDPYSVVRLEDDGDGSPVRIITRNGRPVPVLPSQILERAQQRLRQSHPDLPDALFQKGGFHAPLVQGRDWVEGYVATPEKASRRRNALASAFGSVVGREQGLDRYVSMKGEDRVEVRVDPDTAVPVSVSVSRDGVLQAHTAISYARGAGNSLMRQAVHSQLRISDDRRSVTRTEYSNVRFERRTR
jgi:hypothetical protein